MHKILRKIFIIWSGIAVCCANAPVYQVNATGCDDVQFIFARGSGEELNDTSYQSWQTAITEQIVGAKLKYSFYELGSQAQNGARYPAVAVAGSLGGFGNLLGAFVSAGQSFDFGKSVLEGRNELKAYLTQTTKVCPHTKYVLGGYSQGAMLISGLLDEIASENILYIATFGDPKIYLPEGAGNRPAACRGKNLSNYRAYVSDCRAYEGVLGSYRPYQPAEYLNKLGTWCNGQDMMCSSGLSISDHTAYSGLGLYRHAAATIVVKLRQAFPKAFAASSTTTTEISTTPHDMVIMLHGSGEMDGLVLAKYKFAAKRLASQVRSLGGRVALYVYGDNSKWNYRQLCDFTCTAEEFDQRLAQITHSLSAVDYYNSALSSLYGAMSELSWQIGATKSAVLLTDQPYTQVDYDGRTVAEVAQLSLSIDPVNVYTLTHAGSLERVQPLSQATNGKAYDIESATLAITEISGRPAASLALENYAGIVGEKITFSATSNLNSRKIQRYDWDLDADGRFELQNGGATVEKIYSAPLSGYIQVRVVAQDGTSSTMSARLNITANDVAPAYIRNLRVTKQSNTEYRLDFETNAEQILVSINDMPAGQLRSTQQKYLFVGDVTAYTTVRLIPYNAQTGRGQAVTAELGEKPASKPNHATPGANVSTDAMINNATQSTNPTIGNTTKPNVPGSPFQEPASSASTNPSTSASDAQLGLIKKPASQTASGSVMIPKAPNTGAPRA